MNVALIFELKDENAFRLIEEKKTNKLFKHLVVDLFFTYLLNDEYNIEYLNLPIRIWANIWEGINYNP